MGSLYWWEGIFFIETQATWQTTQQILNMSECLYCEFTTDQLSISNQMSRRHGDIWSHPGHYLVVYTLPSDHFWLRYNKFHILPWKFKVKVMAKVKPDSHIWGLKFNRYVCFSFCSNRTIFGWDIVNCIFGVENSRSRSWLRSNLMVIFDALSSIDMFAICFIVIGPFLAEI